MTTKAQLYLNEQTTERELAKAREVLAAYDELVDTLRAENAVLRGALVEVFTYFENYDCEALPDHIHDRIDAALNG